MKNRKVLEIISIVIYLCIVVLVSFYIIAPGVDKLKESNSIKELSFDEKTNLIDEINNKYIDLEKKVNSKYEPNINEINKKYDDLEIAIKDKYSKIESDIEEKYTKEEKRLSNEINDNKVLQNTEFFANGLSKKYYELSDKGTELFKEKSALDSKKREEIRENEKNKNNEIDKNNELKRSELKNIEDNKNNELLRLKESKQNEINLINKRNTNKNQIKESGIKSIGLGIIIIIIPILYAVVVFNKLTILSNKVEEKWSEVDVLLKQRADLIPNIVETVKGYSIHEKSTLTNITKARNQVVNAKTKEEEINANEKLESIVQKLIVLEEDYPELKANESYMNLQQNLKEIEDNISLSRSNYNNAVLKYKNKLEIFPANIVASLFNFKDELFFEINDTEKENININFK